MRVQEERHLVDRKTSSGDTYNEICLERAPPSVVFSKLTLAEKLPLVQINVNAARGPRLEEVKNLSAPYDIVDAIFATSTNLTDDLLHHVMKEEAVLVTLSPPLLQEWLAQCTAFPM